jgi:hypothetical protein
MIELQHERVRLSAIHARMRSQVFDNVRAIPYAVPLSRFLTASIVRFGIRDVMLPAIE